MLRPQHILSALKQAGVQRPIVRLPLDSFWEKNPLRTRQSMIATLEAYISDPLERTKAKLAVMNAVDDVQAAQALAAAFAVEADSLEQQERGLHRERSYLERRLMAAKDAKAWLDEPIRFERAATSEFHSVSQQNLIVATYERGWVPPEIAEAQTAPLGVFLVQHDWASLLAGTEVDMGEYRLPFDCSCFEMVITGKHVCALVCSENGAPFRLLPIIRVKGGWLIACSFDVRTDLPVSEDAKRSYGNRLAVAIMAQVRAIAITLDAEVTIAEPIRAPHLSNAEIKRGVRQPFDHHVISLARRYRSAPRALPGDGGHKRLHFRRGHWRHYPAHKTWIRWCLVGDPSLGFADKDYAL